MLPRKFASFLTGSLAVLLLATAAHAQFRLSGNIVTATGNFTTRNIPGLGFVSGTAGTLMIPAAVFKESGFAFRTFNTSPSIAQVASSFTSSNDVVTLMAGGGPGSFSWCPQGNSPCSDPDQFSSQANFHGQLVYTAGSATYGGTFRVMRNFIGSLARVVSTGVHSHSNPGTQTNPWGGGLPFSATQATIATGPKIVTSFMPTPSAAGALGPQGSIQTIGTKGLASPGVINQINTSPPTATRFVTGFPATTGMVFAFDRTPMSDLFTWTGSDNRNANGHGAITLVASGYSNNTQGETFPHRLTVTMNIGPMVPTMGASGVAAIGILVVLSGGYMIRRRL